MFAEHYADDLEEELEDAMLQDFNVETEDGSPAEVRRHAFCMTAWVVLALLVPTLCSFPAAPAMQLSKALVSLYQECLQGNFNTVQQLQAQAQAIAAAQAVARSKRQVVGDETSTHAVCLLSLNPL